MAANSTNDRLPSADQGNFKPGWDYKSEYVSELETDGYERFSQFSASPDSTIMYAGPARFTGLSGDSSILKPIGLSDGLAIQANPGLSRLFEMGSNRSFFTRGKTQSGISFSRMLADQQNILAVLAQNSYRPAWATSSQPGSDVGNVFARADWSIKRLEQF